MRRYSGPAIAKNNAPYALMVFGGAFIIGQTLDWTFAGWLSASIYCFYGIVSTLIVAGFVCTHCGFYGTRACSSGYGLLSALFRKRADRSRFARQFKTFIPMIAPLWFLPPVLAGLELYFRFDGWLLALVILFSVNSFILLPLLANKENCEHCAQKHDCPWKSRRKSGAKKTDGNTMGETAPDGYSSDE
ncbi:MAG: hypothetical protein ABIH86_02450 [Planctomycetota bacterium]